MNTYFTGSFLLGRVKFDTLPNLLLTLGHTNNLIRYFITSACGAG